jgi:hypothetical protein
MGRAILGGKGGIGGGAGPGCCRGAFCCCRDMTGGSLANMSRRIAKKSRMLDL